MEKDSSWGPALDAYEAAGVQRIYFMLPERDRSSAALRALADVCIGTPASGRAVPSNIG